VFNALLAVMMGGLLLWKFAGATLLDRGLGGEGMRRLVATAHEITAAVDAAPVASFPRTLVVKSKRDEAKLWLTLVDRSASMLSAEPLLRLTSRMIIAAGELQEWLNNHKWSVVLPISIGILVFAKVMLGADLKAAQAKRLVLAPVLLLVVFSLVHSFVFVTVAVLVRGSTFSFGQSLFLSLVASVSSSADLCDRRCGEHQVVSVTLPPTVFHHASFYVDVATIRAIGAWIEAPSRVRRGSSRTVGPAAVGDGMRPTTSLEDLGGGVG
jgi:hypothetical protein